MADKVYAKVVNGKIVEYPIFPIHIKNRSHPVEWYSVCKFDIKPELTDDFHFLSEILTPKFNDVTNKYEVLISYEIKAFTLQNLLNSIYPLNDSADKKKSDISEALYNRILELANEAVMNRLNNFAASRGYDGIISLCSYRDDSNIKFATEANRGIILRSATWQMAEIYLDTLNNETANIPRNISEIFDNLPSLTWE